MASRLLSRSFASLTRTQSNISRTADGAVQVSYNVLTSNPASLQSSIEEAFGSAPQCLGIILIRDLPPLFPQYRERLLNMANQFAELDPASQEKYTDPKSSYSFGWSHGKEIMNGQPDTLKGSYYANPIVDVPTVPEEEKKAFPEYYGSNIWPTEIQGFEHAFKDLGRLVYNIGIELAAACQPFASPFLSDSSISLPALIDSSQTIKSRLLHYFPPPKDTTPSNDDEPVDSWCGFHLDHSLLTGLCSAMFLKHDGNGSTHQVGSPSPSSGLYIRNRGGDLVKVSIPPDCLAFQVGEALELATNQRLRATPHCVRVGSGAENISRETFVTFLQPNSNQQISPTETFGQFSKRIFAEHYDPQNSASM